MPSQRYRYQKMILQRLIFCKNEACVNCGKENATTLTWLLLDSELKAIISRIHKVSDPIVAQNLADFRAFF